MFIFYYSLTCFCLPREPSVELQIRENTSLHWHPPSEWTKAFLKTALQSVQSCQQMTKINSRSVSDGRTLLLLSWCDLWMRRPHDWLLFKHKPTQHTSYSSWPSQCSSSFFQAPSFSHRWVPLTPWPRPFSLTVWALREASWEFNCLVLPRSQVHYINSPDPRRILPTWRNLFLFLLSWLRGQLTLSWVREKVRGSSACTGIHCGENMSRVS